MKKITKFVVETTLVLGFIDGMIWAAKFYAHHVIGVLQRML